MWYLWGVLVVADALVCTLGGCCGRAGRLLWRNGGGWLVLLWRSRSFHLCQVTALVEEVCVVVSLEGGHGVGRCLLSRVATTLEWGCWRSTAPLEWCCGVWRRSVVGCHCKYRDREGEV